MNSYKVLIIIIGLLFWFGVAGPFMVSSDSDLLVIGWILLTLAGVAFAVERVRKWRRENVRS